MSEKKTISGMLVLQKHLMERRRQLNELAGKSSKRAYWDDRKKTEEPVYDVRVLDQMVAEINLAMVKIDDAIKQSNATVIIDCPVDFDHLMRTIPRDVDLKKE